MNNELKNTMVNPVVMNEKGRGGISKNKDIGKDVKKDIGKDIKKDIGKDVKKDIGKDVGGKTGKRRRRNKRKDRIPKALREQVWLKHCGEVYSIKCPVIWCKNKITVHDFQCGHNIPESKGGSTRIDNLIPLCSRCNLSMGNTYTIDEWNKEFVAGGGKDIGAGVGMGKDDISPAEEDDDESEEEAEGAEGEGERAEGEGERAEGEGERAEGEGERAEGAGTRNIFSILCGCFGWNQPIENTGAREKEIETVNRNDKHGNSETGRRTQTETRKENPKDVARCI